MQCDSAVVVNMAVPGRSSGLMRRPGKLGGGGCDVRLLVQGRGVGGLVTYHVYIRRHATIFKVIPTTIIIILDSLKIFVSNDSLLSGEEEKDESQNRKSLY